MASEEQLTPREEFEQEFGQITDDQWQWLKEFVKRHDHVARVSNVSGLRHFDTGRTYHPSEFQFILRDSGVERSQAPTDPED